MTLLSQFDPPGLLDDLSPQQNVGWSQWISDQMDAAHAGRNRPFDSPRAQFFNPLKTPIADDAVEKVIEWIAFPRQVTVTSTSDVERWKRADSSRDLQDEYCEWSVERESDSGKIVRVTFTCEGPEYWSYLAAVNPQRTLELYRAHVNQTVQMNDLYTSAGKYNLRNKWNGNTTTGAMHLVQNANTLGAEIELAAGASIVRERQGQLLTTEQALIACGRYGEAERNSDPHIGGEVNSVARLKADVTLKNPVGLYFSGIDFQNWKTPDGTDAATFWHYTRGANGIAVRATLEVPMGKGYGVGDILIDDHAIEFGAQIVDRINMKLIGIGCRIGKSPVAAMQGCVGDPSPMAALAAAPSVEEAWHRHSSTR